MRGVVPDGDNLETSINTYLSTDLVIVYIVWYLGLFFFTWGEVAALEALMDVPNRKPSYGNVFNALAIIIGIIYAKVYNESFDGYATGPTSYRALLFNIESFSSKLFTFCTPVNSKKRIIGLGELNEILNDARESLVAMTYFSLKLFDPEDDHILRQQLVSNRVLNIKEYSMDQIHAVKSLLNNIFLDLSYMEENGIIPSSQISRLSNALDSINDTIKQIDISMSIKLPRIFKTHVLFTLFIYFLIWTPFSIWLTVGYWWTIIINPAILFLLFVPMIIRNWIREPFDHSRRLKLMPFNQWRNDTTDKINSDYNQCCINNNIQK